MIALPAGPTLIRLAWTAIGLFAYVFSIRTQREAHRNLVALRKAGKNGRLELVAKNNVQEETLRVLKSVVIVAIGAVAVAFPTSSARITVASLAVTGGLFIVGVLIAAGAVLRLRFYREFEHLTLVERRKTPR